MKRKILKVIVFMAAIAGVVINGTPESKDIYAMESTVERYDINTDPYFQSDMDLYYKYVESHELEDFLDGSQGIFSDITMYNDIYSLGVKVADFDGDNRAEVWITGPAAVANYIAGILDISDGEVKCVFNGWGSEAGRYANSLTGESGLVIHEGNADGENCHLRDCLYDENWKGNILYDMQGNEENEIVYIACTDNEERQLTMNEYDEETYNLYNDCIKTEAVKEIEVSGENANDYMNKQEILEFLRGLISTESNANKDVLQNRVITDYPEYDEIIRQYYMGRDSNWSMNEFREKNLCYLAGREMGGAEDLGYCLMDINEDGIDELIIGTAGEHAYTGMFFDLYTIVAGQRVLVISSGQRDRYYVSEDHTIANEGSGGARNSFWAYYNLVSGQLELKEGVVFNADDHPENPWFYTTTNISGDYSNPISEEEGRGVIGKYTYMNIPYILLKEINSENHGETGENGITSPMQQAEQTSPAQQIEQKITETEQRASAIEAEISENSDIPDEEYRQKLNELYEIWDEVLNELWTELKNALPSEEMDVLTQEEVEWINNKENTISSIRSVSEAEALLEAVELTKERVYVLLDRLIY